MSANLEAMKHLIGTVNADGRHKHGGSIYYTVTEQGKRVTLGVVRKQPATVTDPAKRYLLNDWTLRYEDRGADGRGGVTYFASRGPAMAAMKAIAERTSKGL